ncbi:MAG TPA: DUF6318 family protein [Dermatophilaceae bacterium]|nr:DUF6318 family protein [Dermatophilaceae bacterium]
MGSLFLRSRALTVVTLTALTALVGCSGGDPEGAPTPTGTSRPPVTSSSVPTTPPTPTATTTAVDPNYPAAARKNTSKGAEAFVRYYFENINVSWRTANPVVLERLSLPECKTCINYIDTAKGYAKNGQHQRGDIFETTGIFAESRLPSETGVAVLGRQLPSPVIDSAGAVVRTPARRSLEFYATVRFVDSIWWMKHIQVAK